jgi:hypothetical protein
MATAFAASGRAAPRSRFHLWMALAATFFAFSGFVPTYFAPLAAGRFTGQPIMHFHGMLFFAWTLLFLSQSALVAAGRTPDHRKWGMLGLVLMGMMAVTVPLASINSMHVAEGISPEAAELARRFTAVPLTGLALMLGLFGVAIANVHRPEVHKRLMLVLMVSMLQAPFSRFVALALTPPGAPPGPPPGAFVSIPGGLAMDLLLVVAMVRDKRMLGHVHSAYVWGLAVVVAQQLLVVPISFSDGWLAFATWLQGLVR